MRFHLQDNVEERKGGGGAYIYLYVYVEEKKVMKQSCLSSTLQSYHRYIGKRHPTDLW